MAGLDLLGRLFARAGNRDGQFRALEPAALDLAPVPAPGPASDAGRDLEIAVATKLLDGWLNNRQQTLVPHTLNFGALSPDEARLLLGVMAAAAQADGQVDPREARQLPLALERVGAGEAEVRDIARLLGELQPLAELLAGVQEAGLGAHAYAAACLAINRRGRANRAFLGYLGARLGLAPDITAALERRYRA